MLHRMVIIMNVFSVEEKHVMCADSVRKGIQEWLLADNEWLSQMLSPYGCPCDQEDCSLEYVTQDYTLHSIEENFRYSQRKTKVIDDRWQTWFQWEHLVKQDKGCRSTNKKSSTQNKHQVWSCTLPLEQEIEREKAYWMYLRWEKLLAPKEAFTAVLMLGNNNESLRICMRRKVEGTNIL